MCRCVCTHIHLHTGTFMFCGCLYDGGNDDGGEGGIRLEWKMPVWKFLEGPSSWEGPLSPSYAPTWSLTYFCAF